MLSTGPDRQAMQAERSLSGEQTGQSQWAGRRPGEQVHGVLASAAAACLLFGALRVTAGPTYAGRAALERRDTPGA